MEIQTQLQANLKWLMLTVHVVSIYFWYHYKFYNSKLRIIMPSYKEILDFMVEIITNY